jgi:hypothetical protein
MSAMMHHNKYMTHLEGVTLGAIRAVTFAVDDLARATVPYVEVLQYVEIACGTVSAEEADRWQAPRVAGRAYRTLGPASGEPVYLRFVEQPGPQVAALTSHGWNATEIVVQQVDSLMAQLAAHDAFTIIGPPRSLTRFPMIRAMQCLGPSGECLYFTQIGPGSGLDLAPALSPVGRVFIVVAGGADVDQMFSAYAAFDNATDPPVATPIAIISEANGLPPGTCHPHGLVKLAEGTMIELDGYPSRTRPRPVEPGFLPPGMAMVSVDGGARSSSALFIGAAGERIEILGEDDR